MEDANRCPGLQELPQLIFLALFREGGKKLSRI
jgi:hypothetical protein